VYYKIGWAASFDYLGFEGLQEMANCPCVEQFHWGHMVWQEPMSLHSDSRVIGSFQNASARKHRCDYWSHWKLLAWDYFPLYQHLLLLSGFAMHHLSLTAIAAG
jgi:hypothetical protein